MLRYDHFYYGVVLCFVLMYAVEHAAGAQRALLIGVSRYDHPGIQDLAGPTNDVHLMAESLMAKGFPTSHIVILTDGEPEHRLPTHRNILTALQRLIEQAEPEDQIVLYFAGHGSQQPAQRTGTQADEPDGQDEFFLTRDTGDWDQQTGSATRIILDNEIQTYLEKLHQKRAFVWVIFDTCHAGTMTRKQFMPDLGWKYRHVDPAVLKIPKRSGLTPSVGITRGAQQEDGALESLPLFRRGYVAFYAAQSRQLTQEMRLPYGTPDAKPHGIFTYTLAATLRQYANLSYRQTAQYIMQHYTKRAYRPTPLIEGGQDDLDRLMFSSSVRYRALRQWPIQSSGQQLRLRAGYLSHLTKGTRLAVLASPADQLDQATGYVEITRADAFESHLRPVAHNNLPALQHHQLPKQAYARLAEPNVTLSLRIARPSGPREPPSPLIQQALTCLQTLSRLPQLGSVRITWVPATDAADLYLHIKYQVLWLLRPDAKLIKSGKLKSHHIPLTPNCQSLQAALTAYVQRFTKIYNLMRLADFMPGTELRGIRLHADMVRQNETRGTLLGRRPMLNHGDRLRFAVENRNRHAIDVTMLFVDSQLGIYADYPHPNVASTNRIEAQGSSRPVTIQLDNTNTAGLEHMIIIAVRARPKTLPADFSFLQQQALPKHRDANDSPLYRLFAAAGFGDALPTDRLRGRHIVSQPMLDDVFMRVLSWHLANDEARQKP